MALVVGSGAATLASACGSDASTLTPTQDGGGGDGALPRSDCPKAEPADGTLCLLPEGTTCDFGLCGTRLARCSQGAWRVGGNAAPSPACPKDPPNNTPCPACWPRAISCPYGSTDCSAADASVNAAIASCPNGTWILEVRPCRDGGGPDVQGDGGPDAD